MGNIEAKKISAEGKDEKPEVLYSMKSSSGEKFIFAVFSKNVRSSDTIQLNFNVIEKDFVY